MAIYLFIACYAVIKYPGDAAGTAVLLIGFAVVLLKNLMGHRLYLKTKNNEIHEDGFGALFFILWFFNVIIFVMIIGMITDDLSGNPVARLFQRSIDDILMLTSSYIFVFTELYTLILDVTLEKKVKKNYDAALGLLQDD
jgi:hypothetical protein